LCLDSMMVQRPVFPSGTLEVADFQRDRFMGLTWGKSTQALLPSMA